MNINELKELVKHCVYIEKGVTCMSDTYYNDMIQTIENLQSKIDKARKIIDRISRVVDYDDEVSIDILYEIDDVLTDMGMFSACEKTAYLLGLFQIILPKGKSEYQRYETLLNFLVEN